MCAFLLCMLPSCQGLLSLINTCFHPSVYAAPCLPPQVHASSVCNQLRLCRALQGWLVLGAEGAHPAPGHDREGHTPKAAHRDGWRVSHCQQRVPFCSCQALRLPVSCLGCAVAANPVCLSADVVAPRCM